MEVVARYQTAALAVVLLLIANVACLAACVETCAPAQPSHCSQNSNPPDESSCAHPVFAQESARQDTVAGAIVPGAHAVTPNPDAIHLDTQQSFSPLHFTTAQSTPPLRI